MNDILTARTARDLTGRHLDRVFVEARVYGAIRDACFKGLYKAYILYPDGEILEDQLRQDGFAVFITADGAGFTVSWEKKNGQ